MQQAGYQHIKKEKYNSWIYILEQKDGSRSIHYTFDIAQAANVSSHGSRLIFYRGFSDPIDSMAYKVFIENLSPESITRIIAMKNPGLKNLYDEFKTIK